MLKKSIEYVDYEGNSRTEDFYFNLTKAECLEMELSLEGGLSKTVERIVAAQDNKQIMEIFKELILKAYGEKSPDGRRFVKTQEIRDGFAQTEAYSELFIELATNADAAAIFVNGITPVMAPTPVPSPEIPKLGPVSV
jgi:hypothetical protein